MSVYVDRGRIPYRRMLMCHMIADTTEELLSMVDKIGVERRHLQDAGTYCEHFDLCQSKRDLAVENGAIEVTNRQLGLMLRAKRGRAA